MGWSLGYDERWQRDIGYGVPATCDHPGCGKEIDRGLAYVCGGEPWGGDEGCGLFFCDAHMEFGATRQVCRRCLRGKRPFTPTSDSVEWVEHKLTDPTWQGWRDENTAEVERLRAVLPSAVAP